jgi:hypothetical protein
MRRIRKKHSGLLGSYYLWEKKQQDYPIIHYFPTPDLLGKNHPWEKVT